MRPVESSRLKVRRRTILGASIGMIGLAYATAASADGDLVDLAVVDRETGQPLTFWRHHGRLFIAGEIGARYSLRVTNNTDRRVLVVLSVDGVNVVTGQTASYDQNGYVLFAHQSYDVPGWRKTNSEVADFTFTPLPQSYAARTGRPANVGVIGMAVFTEKVAAPAYVPTQPPAPPSRRPPPPILPRAATPPPFDIPPPVLPIPPVRGGMSEAMGPPAPAPPSPPAPPAPPAAPDARVAALADPRTGSPTPKPFDERLGTGHGAREISVVFNVNFERATRAPQAVRQIEYDTFDHLVAAGVIPRYADYGPRPFPAKPDGQGYVPDPPS